MISAAFVDLATYSHPEQLMYDEESSTNINKIVFILLVASLLLFYYLNK